MIKKCLQRKMMLLVFMMSVLMLSAAVSSAIAGEKATQEEGWQFTAASYMWATSLGMTTATGSEVEIDFDDIFDNLEMTFMGVFEVRKGKWSVITDVVYVNMKKDDISYNAAIPVGPGGSSSVFFGVDAEVEMTSWILTPAVGYSVIQNEKMSMDVVGGARYLYIKSDAKLNITAELDAELLGQSIVRTGEINGRITESDDLWDGIVGIRGQINLNEKWYLPYYADVGTGDSDMTWQALGGVGYRFSRIDVVAGYRYIAWEFDDAALEDLDVSGPLVGARISF